MFTLKIARSDKGFVTHKFTDLRACFACLDMLRSAGKVRHAWIYDKASAGTDRLWETNIGSCHNWWLGLIYSN